MTQLGLKQIDLLILAMPNNKRLHEDPTLAEIFKVMCPCIPQDKYFLLDTIPNIPTTCSLPHRKNQQGIYFGLESVTS